MKRPITIAIYSKDIGVGGIQRSLINLLGLLSDSSKYRIDLYLFSENVFFSEDALPANVTVVHLRQNTLASRFIPFDLYYLFGKNSIKKEYDYVVDFDGFLNKQSVTALKTIGKKHIIWVHTDIYQLYRYYRDRPLGAAFYWLMHMASRNRWKRFDTIVGVSSPILDPLKKRFKESEYLVIPNGLDTREIIAKSQKRNDTDVVAFDAANYNLLSVGRLSPQKNYPQTIKDLADILNSREDIHYYIIGDGMDKKHVEKLIDTFKLHDKITLLGALNNPYQYYVQADGFILNSKLEGQGIVLLEAQIFGLDLYYPERLSDVIPDLSQYRKDIAEITTAKKHNKQKIDYLDEYNKMITTKVNNLFKGDI